MFKTTQARLPRRITLAVFILLLVAIVATQAEGRRSIEATTATPQQAESGLLVRRMAKVAVELVAPSRQADSLTSAP